MIRWIVEASPGRGVYRRGSHHSLGELARMSAFASVFQVRLRGTPCLSMMARRVISTNNRVDEVPAHVFHRVLIIRVIRTFAGMKSQMTFPSDLAGRPISEAVCSSWAAHDFDHIRTSQYRRVRGMKALGRNG